MKNQTVQSNTKLRGRRTRRRREFSASTLTVMMIFCFFTRRTIRTTASFCPSLSTTSSFNNWRKKIGSGGTRTNDIISRWWGEEDSADVAGPPTNENAIREFRSTSNSNSDDNVIMVDEEGRRIRKSRRQGRSPFRIDNNGDGLDDNDDWNKDRPITNLFEEHAPKRKRGGGRKELSSEGGDWDDFLPSNNDASNLEYKRVSYSKDRDIHSSSARGTDRNRRPSSFSSSSSRRRNSNHNFRPTKNRYNSDDEERTANWNEQRKSYNHNKGRHNNFRNDYNYNSNSDSSSPDRKINRKALSKAGFVHLYGLAPVLNALSANRRDLTNPAATIDVRLLDEEDKKHEIAQRERKPEAQFAPYLFIQTGGGGGGKKLLDKASAAQKLETLAKERNVPVAHVDKGVLNSLVDSRPHQGYVLRCGALNFNSLMKLPAPSLDGSTPKLWLALDEIVDPQNLGAILRSAWFLGGGTAVGILVCSKNSAPPSASVSAASAGALELCRVHSTSNLPKTLTSAKEDGWRILGAAAATPFGADERITCEDLLDVETGHPTVLVLGSEGHGLRTLVAKACDGFVRIPSGCVGGAMEQEEYDGMNGDVGVDSLNVGVTGGILLWHFMS